MSTRLLLFGLDGATWDLVTPWLEAGELPNLARLCDQGARMTLRSTIPAISPPAWTSILTGQNPGKHGIFDFIRRQPGSYLIESVRADFTNYRTIFDHVSAAGGRVASINVPLTYPPRPVNGIVVAGLGAATSADYTHPPELKQDLAARGYELDVGYGYNELGDARFVQEVRRVMRGQVDFAREQLEAGEWDLFMLVLRGTDEAQGFLWHHLDPTHPAHDPAAAARLGSPVLQVYRESDRLLGKMLEAAGPEAAILLLSDHGGGPLHREVYLNHWLHEQGYLVLKEGATGGGPSALLRRLGLTRERLSPLFDGPAWRRLRRAVPLRWQHALIPGAAPSLADQVDWSRTRAYSLGYIGQIYVNLAGREPAGIVSEAAYEPLLDEIEAGLRQMVDPADGRPVVDQIYRGSEIYHGPYAARGPDLNLIMRGMRYIAHVRREMAHDALFGPVTTGESGTHRPEGLAIAAGAPFRSGVLLDEHSLLDIAPTALHLLSLPVPDDMDGRVMHDAFRRDYLTAHPIAHRSADPLDPTDVNPGTWTDAEAAELEARLRDLGYLG